MTPTRSHPSIVYNAQVRTGIEGFDGRACSVAPEATLHTLRDLLVTGQHGRSRDRLRAAFPEAQVAAEGPATPLPGDLSGVRARANPGDIPNQRLAWATREIVPDSYRIQTPPHAPPGTDRLLSGVSLIETLARLPASDAQGSPLADDAVPLGTLNVRGANDEPQALF